MKYKYRTIDKVTGEVHHYFDFKELKNYLDIYSEELEIRDSYKKSYECKNESDAIKICEAINIKLEIL